MFEKQFREPFGKVRQIHTNKDILLQNIISKIGYKKLLVFEFGGIIVYVESARDNTKKNQNKRRTKKMKNEATKNLMTNEDMESCLQAAIKELFEGKVEKSEKGATLLLDNGQTFRFYVESV